MFKDISEWKPNQKIVFIGSHNKIKELLLKVRPRFEDIFIGQISSEALGKPNCKYFFGDDVSLIKGQNLDYLNLIFIKIGSVNQISKRLLIQTALT